MIKKSLQLIADKLIIKLSNSNNEEEFNHYYNLGMMLNDFSINVFDIYLD